MISIKLIYYISIFLFFRPSLGCFAQLADKGNGKESLVYVAKYKDGKACAISYTFDDGLKEHYDLEFPMLEKYGLHGTFWIWGKCIDNESASLGKFRMSWAELIEMPGKGHEISNHSWSHHNLPSLDKNALLKEIVKNDSIIFHYTNKIPRTFCYPGNFRKMFKPQLSVLQSIDGMNTT